MSSISHTSTQDELRSDVHKHAKLAKKELRMAIKLEHKAQKEQNRLSRSLRKGDISGAEKHSTQAEALKAEALQHKAISEQESYAKGVSEYDLAASKFSSSAGSARG